MDAKLLTKLFAIGVVLILGRVSAVEAVSTASVDNLRVSWSDGVMAEGWRAVCGDVRNVGQLSARGVAIRVLGLGSASQVISTRDHYILADVPAGGRAVFVCQCPPGRLRTTSWVSVPTGDPWRHLRRAQLSMVEATREGGDPTERAER